ncbi:hypothetical protein Q0N48_08340 [Corynebacterium ureicelerivorans]|uniref:hypothetical protein n=1 Tax=Corynebacterium ureicelerivorans TaxID=401472 RepID=UPI0026560E72|nr:hypothetical protein [Corynebacterium ureicelerivorans]MDN8606000.1 hypothetical protein [Corynebacterium ureicelerivorans]
MLGFFRHQFTAPSLFRLLWMVPLAVMFGLGATITNHALTAVMTPAVVTLFVIGALSMEETAYSAYGMPRDRRLRLAAMAVVPAVVIGAAVALLLRPDWFGVVGALGAIAIGLIMGQRYVTGEVPEASERVRSRVGSRGFLVELVWKPQLLWALGIAVAHCVTLYLASFIGSEPLRAWIGMLPLLAWYYAYCTHGTGIAGPDVGASYGVPRRRWLGVSLAASVVSVLFYVVVVGVVSSLSWAAVAVGAAGAFACAVLGTAIKARRREMGMFPAMFMAIPISRATEVEDFTDGEAVYLLVIAGILLLVGAAMQVAYLGGYMNLKTPSKKR